MAPQPFSADATAPHDFTAPSDAVSRDAVSAPRGIIARLTSVIPARFQGRLCAGPEDAIAAARQLWMLYRTHYPGRLPSLVAALVDNAAGDLAQVAATETTALERGCSWALVLTSARAGAPQPGLHHSLLVLEAQPHGGDECAVTAIHQATGERRCWHVVGVLDLDGPEPDWEQLRAEQLHREGGVP